MSGVEEKEDLDGDDFGGGLLVSGSATLQGLDVHESKAHAEAEQELDKVLTDGCFF